MNAGEQNAGQLNTGDGARGTTRRSRLTALVQGPAGWIALSAIAVVVLAIGSVHPAPSSASARISYLDSIIKCPSCDNLSIAESNASTAVALRALVATDVRDGETNSAIEGYVVDRYGAAVLLSPTDSLVWIVPIVGLVLAALGMSFFLLRRGRHQRSIPPGDEPGIDAATGGVTGEGDDDLVAAALAHRQGSSGAQTDH